MVSPGTVAKGNPATVRSFVIATRQATTQEHSTQLTPDTGAALGHEPRDSRWCFVTRVLERASVGPGIPSVPFLSEAHAGMKPHDWLAHEVLGPLWGEAAFLLAPT